MRITLDGAHFLVEIGGALRRIGDPPEKNIWNVAIVSFKKHAPENVRSELCSRYKALAKECGGEKAGLLLWKVGEVLHDNGWKSLMAIGAFRNRKSFQVFTRHPKYKEFEEMLHPHANIFFAGNICDEAESLFQASFSIKEHS